MQLSDDQIENIRGIFLRFDWDFDSAVFSDSSLLVDSAVISDSSFLAHTDVWNHLCYVHKKQRALEQDPRFRNLVWHRRDIMPDCVIKCVRG